MGQRVLKTENKQLRTQIRALQGLHRGTTSPQEEASGDIVKTRVVKQDLGEPAQPVAPQKSTEEKKSRVEIVNPTNCSF